MRYRLVLAAGILIAATSALSAQPLYRLHDDGNLWVSKAETCSGKACVEWHLLDNNLNTRQITAGGAPGGGFDPLKAPPDAPPLYKRHADGKIWRYTGTPCSNGTCPGWEMIDNNQRTMSIVAAGEHLYERRSDGIWGYRGRATCRPDGTCPGWERLDNNSSTVEITAGGIPEQTELYQRQRDGSIWRYRGTPCSSDTSCPPWERLDNHSNTAEITATVLKRSDGTLVQALYQRRADGTIWRYKGTPCSPTSCSEWEQLDNDSRTISIVTATDQLYQLRNDGTILVYIQNHPCSGRECLGWRLLDSDARNRQITAGAVSLYKRLDNGAIWRYAGPATEWQLLYDPTTWTIVSTQN